MTGQHEYTGWHTCVCGKRAYPSRRIAKLALRRHRQPVGMHAYQCGERWHLGHKPTALVRGTITRADCTQEKR